MASNPIQTLFGDCGEGKSIIMVGLNATGKQTILEKLKLGEIVITEPNPGFTVKTVDCGSVRFVVWDVGGQAAIRPLWRQYFPNTLGVIYVVDSSDSEKMVEARDEVNRLMNEDELRDAVLLVFANKQDLPSAKNAATVTDELRLHNISNRQWYIQASCATSGDGLYEGIEWLASHIQKK